MRALRQTGWFWCVLLCLSSAGCVGAEDDVAGASSDLVQVAPGTPPLPHVDDDEWRSAPAGCEGRLDGAVAFQVVSSHDGLIVAIEADGDIRCVDTVGSVQEELEETGHEQEAQDLGHSFLAASFPTRRSFVSGDPTPQPNTEPLRGQRSDPTPQPNMEP